MLATMDLSGVIAPELSALAAADLRDRLHLRQPEAAVRFVIRGFAWTVEDDHREPSIQRSTLTFAFTSWQRWRSAGIWRVVPSIRMQFLTQALSSSFA
jgi:hypothetical protein